MKNTLILSMLALSIAGIVTGCCCGSNSNSNTPAPAEEVAMETIQIIPCPVCSKKIQQQNPDDKNQKHPHIAACSSGKCDNSAGNNCDNSTGNAANTGN